MRDIEKLKRANAELRNTDQIQFVDMCKSAAPLMYNLYTDLFNRLVKDELNLAIMIKLIRILEMIEEAQIDQNEGSVMVGKILKELYVDSAVRCGDNLDKANKTNEPVIEKAEPKKIRWNEWKRTL
jgi:hypothetical protein